MMLLIFKNYNHMLKSPFSFLWFSFSLARNYSLNSKSYEVFVLALACCYSPVEELSLLSRTNTNSPIEVLGATNAYLRATEFLWSDENWGDSARRRRHLQLMKGYFPLL